MLHFSLDPLLLIFESTDPHALSLTRIVSVVASGDAARWPRSCSIRRQQIWCARHCQGADVFCVHACHCALPVTRGGGCRNIELDGEVISNMKIEAIEISGGDGLR